MKKTNHPTVAGSARHTYHQSNHPSTHQLDGSVEGPEDASCSSTVTLHANHVELRAPEIRKETHSYVHEVASARIAAFAYLQHCKRALHTYRGCVHNITFVTQPNMLTHDLITSLHSTIPVIMSLGTAVQQQLCSWHCHCSTASHPVLE